MKKRLRKKMREKHGKSLVIVSSISEGIHSSSLSRKNIKDLEIIRNMVDGKNLITIKVNGELIFSYDSNFKGDYIMFNNIQTPK